MKRFMISMLLMIGVTQTNAMKNTSIDFYTSYGLGTNNYKDIFACPESSCYVIDFLINKDRPNVIFKKSKGRRSKTKNSNFEVKRLLKNYTEASFEKSLYKNQLNACDQKIKRRLAGKKKEKYAKEMIVRLPEFKINKCNDRIHSEETALRKASCLHLTKHAKKRIEERVITKEQIAQALLYGKHFDKSDSNVKCVYDDPINERRYTLVVAMNRTTPRVITCYSEPFEKLTQNRIKK